jgi:hypothetical protein
MLGKLAHATLRNEAIPNSLTTIMQLLAAADHFIEIVRIDVTLDGGSPTATPVDVELWIQTGGGTATAFTAGVHGPFKANKQITDDLGTTGQHTFTVEPTSDDVCVGAFHVHPQSGIFWSPPASIVIPEQNRFGVLMNAAASVNANLSVWFNEY